MEVIHDLDVEAAQTAERVGLRLARAATPGTHPRFVSMITELVRERVDGQVPGAMLGTLQPPRDICRNDCCPAGPVSTRPGRAG
jgi:protoporphyrin/coproporphyrin ferrochelatase